LLSLPVVSRHGDRDRFRSLGNRKCCQEARAERHPVQGIFANKSLHDPSVRIRRPLWRAKGDETDSSVTRRSRTLWVGSWATSGKGLQRNGMSSFHSGRRATARTRNIEQNVFIVATNRFPRTQSQALNNRCLK